MARGGRGGDLVGLGSMSGSRMGMLRVAIGAAALVAVAVLEERRPLRRGRSEPKARRDFRNAAVAAVSGGVLHAVAPAFLQRLAARGRRRGWGVLRRLRLPAAVHAAAALLLFDYTLYLWHVLLHKVPALWRFHRVHHVDIDMDASTALRFHVGELLIAQGWHALQIRLIGPSPRAFALWRGWLMASVLFHHANLRLPERAERLLSRLVVTPRMHGIHHSIVRERERDANWSSGLTVWDAVHGTLRLDIPQDELVIGDPAYRDARDLTLARILVQPFRRQRPERLPGGLRPTRGTERRLARRRLLAL